MATTREDAFAKAALAAGHLTHESLIAARGRSEELAAAGTPTALWKILADMGAISPDDASLILAKLGEATETASPPPVSAPAQIPTGAGPADSGMTPKAGGDTTALGKYRITARIGAGGMGAVYKAFEAATGQVVAIKVLPPQLASQPALVERFLLEARHTIKLSHPNIVQGLDAGCVDGYYYFAMEFIDGVTSGQLLAERGQLPQSEVFSIAVSIAKGLQHAADNDLVHGDVKPENIMITKDGLVKLADLGVARSAEASTEGPALGTPYYIAPEQARSGKAIDIRSDIYSRGATLFHLLAGKPPYLGPTPRVVIAKHIQQKIPDVRDRAEGVSKGFSQIIRRMMAKDPSGRYESPAEILEDIQRLRDGKPLVRRGGGGGRPGGQIAGAGGRAVSRLRRSSGCHPDRPASP